MKILKNIFAQLHRFVFWALILTLFWSWIYSFVGDTTRDKKIILYVDAYDVDQEGLSFRLEDAGLPEGIKLVQVRSFADQLFSSTLDGDIYIIRESLLRASLEETPEKQCAIQLPTELPCYEWEGQRWALLVFDAAAQSGPARDCILYSPLNQPETENYYLSFDAQSLHLQGNPGAIDNAAWELAMKLLAMDD